MSLRQANGAVALSGALASGANNGAAIRARGNRAVFFGVHATAVSGTSPTLDVKLQESDDNSSWSDVAGATLTQVTAANKNFAGYAQVAKRFVRAVGTVGGTATPTVTATVTVFVA